MAESNSWDRFEDILDKYGPLPMLACSFVLGWVITYQIRSLAGRSQGMILNIFSLRVVTQILLLLLSCWGWLWGLAVGKKKALYHSGSRKVTKSQLARYVKVFAVAFPFLLLLAVLALLQAEHIPNPQGNLTFHTFLYMYFYLFCFAFMVTLASEIGYDNPWTLWNKPIKIFKH